MENVCVLNLLQIQTIDFYIDKEFLESIDYILLTSKNAIKSIMQHKYAQIFLQKKAIVIGEITKKKWEREGGQVLFCPDDSCNGEQLAMLMIETLSDIIHNKNILYVCGRDKATDLVRLLRNECNITDLIVYESNENIKLLENIQSSFAFKKHNMALQQTSEDSLMSYQHHNNKLHTMTTDSNPDAQALENIAFPNESIFIFGSPKHYQIFKKYFHWNQTWLAISLGNTTFQAFDENIRKLNAKGNFEKALQVAHAINNDTPMQNNNPLLHDF
ncbi:hypothetical protein CQA53_02110 [Helicobacter didelphidarum]|uniref:Tetrapyrrole biosynthesis uroporphyrinogen III synthase domain-containing protein n=2 Tax=Helicobacter didelphidarum TaxID=2040648 RepID=A0A3D8IQH5_9HELI|nr:hypothetical protein CQA53_02110 [Helicobacter didelphidarum]